MGVLKNLTGSYSASVLFAAALAAVAVVVASTLDRAA